MAICTSGIEQMVLGQEILIKINNKHPLLILANNIPWQEMVELILDDLKNTTPTKSVNLGRKLKIRLHLGAYLLQQMYNLKDRETEWGIKSNAAYQIFCGYGIVEKWHSLDHSKIAAFRNRLSPETQKKIANLMCVNAVNISLASPSETDIDSTVQEANMTYPTDAKMLRKLATIAGKVSDGIKALINVPIEMVADLDVDLRLIASKARACFFLPKKTEKQKKSAVLSELWNAVSEPVVKVISVCKSLADKVKDGLAWNVKRSMNQLLAHGEAYLESSKLFIETGKAEIGKRLSFHLDNVACFTKNKAHKKHEFGRGFQLGRIAGNFIFVGKCTDVRMDDKESLIPMLDEHIRLFGEEKLDSLATDKGYYSKNNIKSARNKGVNKVGIQIPSNIATKNRTPDGDSEVLRNRRSGIEPLIGHIKHGGQLGRSRMKNDRNIESSGYSSVLGFNLRQTMNALIKVEQGNALVF